MNRKLFFNILKIVVSVGLLIFIFSIIDLEHFLAEVGGADPVWLLVAVVMMMLGVVMRAYRWQILLNAIGVRVPIGELTAIYLIGFLFNNVLPSGLGGDAIRMVELNRHSERGSDAVTSVVVDRFLGLSALQAIALVALIFDWGAVPIIIAYFTIIIFVAGLILGYLLINRSLYLTLQARIKLFRRLTAIGFIGNLFESFQRYPLIAIGRAYIVSLFFNITLIVMNVFIGLALGAQANLVHYAIFVPIASLVLILPISLAGLGVREGAYIQLFGLIGVREEIAFAISLLVYVIGNIIPGLFGGVIYLLRSAHSVVSEKG